MSRNDLTRRLIRQWSRPETADSDSTALAIRHFIHAAPARKGVETLRRVFGKIDRQHGCQSAFNLLKQLEVSFALRKPSLAIYDHTLHLIGGAQKYGCTIAHALQDEFDVTLIANRPVTQHELQNWYQLDLSRCRIAVIPIAFFEEQNMEHLDPAVITSRRMANPFHPVSLESGRYDFFINNSMVEMVYPLASRSLFVCHFPERRPVSYFYVDRYRQLIHNSRYTAAWIRKKWDLDPGIHIYPPVDMAGPVHFAAKENIILSAARFDPGGNKQQLAMVRIFNTMLQKRPHDLRGWKLVLAGGSPADNPYLQRVRRTVAEYGLANVELLVNIPATALKELYQRAKIFWHLCGLNQDEAELFEHFGMTTVEAMQNGCVPVVFAGGGLVEIVADDVSGQLFADKSQLIEQTLRLITEPRRLSGMGEQACQRGSVFSREVFTVRVRELFAQLLQQYRLDGKS